LFTRSGWLTASIAHNPIGRKHNLKRTFRQLKDEPGFMEKVTSKDAKKLKDESMSKSSYFRPRVGTPGRTEPPIKARCQLRPNRLGPSVARRGRRGGADQ